MSHRITNVACPLCGNTAEFRDVWIKYLDKNIGDYGDLYGSRTKSSWKICGECGFVHQNPRPATAALNDFYLRAQYRAEQPPTPSDYKVFSRWYYEEKFKYVTDLAGIDRGAVYDIGCGYGGALSVFKEHGWDAYGVESDKNCSDFATQQLGIAVTHGVLDRSAEPAGAVDVVFSNHSFEHFADLTDVMEGIVRLLKPGGLVFTAVPTYRANRSTLSKRWMNSRHYSLFTHKSLDQLFARYGFEPVAHTYRGWFKEIDELWHVARYTGKSTNPREHYEDPGEVDRYLRIVNPVRTAFFYPVFDRYSQRRQLLESALYISSLLVTSPKTFFRKLGARVSRLWRPAAPKS